MKSGLYVAKVEQAFKNILWFLIEFLMTLQILGLGILFRVNVNEVDLGSAPFLNSSKSIYKLFVVW